MHLLRAQAGAIADGSEAVDLGQTPGDIVVLSAADTELSNLAVARVALGRTFPTVRLANLMQLSHNVSVDLYIESVVQHARVVIVRMLGGVGYWAYGVEQLTEVCESRSIPLALLPGDDHPDPELSARCTLAPDVCHRLWQYCVHGGPDNARNFLCYSASVIGRRFEWLEPIALQRAGIYWPGHMPRDLADLGELWVAGAPVAAIVFYRALVQASNVAPVDALVGALRDRSINALPIFCASLKEPVSAGIVGSLVEEAGPDIILNATGFSVSTPGAPRSETPFDEADCVVLQVVFSGGNESAWCDGTAGLSARDIAMNVALPEVDGRVLSRAVSFKGEARFDKATQSPIITYAPREDRVRFVAELARNWVRLRHTPRHERRVAILLANYPNRDGRIGNGVGLDTPAGTLNLLKAMALAGYHVTDTPSDGNALIRRLERGPTNATVTNRVIANTLSRARYEAFFTALPSRVREAVNDRWGLPDSDPFSIPSDSGDDAFAMPAFICGNVIIGLQPARGYHIDPAATYHDPDLVPPHGYLAFYAWLRDEIGVHAVVHMGKHGNLEWLPGKSLALSEECYPEVALGALPHLYPFIVNDPGEGTQAKRRSQAVIVDHLTPPLTRAESYGSHAELEQLIDEYYEAAALDVRRLRVLRTQILELTQRIGLDRDCGIEGEDDTDTALGKLDNYLCELKEMQIRDGLHVFGESPAGEQLTDLLVAITRVPRGSGGADASIVRALALDLGLEGFDPLDCELGQAWLGARPSALANSAPWRTCGDTLERLEALAKHLVDGSSRVESSWSETALVLENINKHLRPAVLACGAQEMIGVLKGLDGVFVEPGPSGAPTRGRSDVLPTGRNFYSLDTRTVPTPAAWHLGWKSASLLVERYRQENGAWPQRVALSAWGTSNMRTGGDDIAQALALLGVKPTWDVTTRRVTGFEIVPLDLLDRPRVDVTLRVSGFFRDAFPAQIDLFDSASRAVAALEEPAEKNPLADRVGEDTRALVERGLDHKSAAQKAGYRVFGSKPGAYGAGLQALIDERGWRDESDLARAYLAWGGYAYGAGADGAPEQQLFEVRLTGVQAVLHNQDNREHDLLDSDDYYQFEGGITAAVRYLSGDQPKVYHNDHSRPETPRIRTLQEEIARVVRARVVNPKWLRGVMRHGYKGAFEMAATVDYLFAFAATARSVADHHFDAVYEAYLENSEVREFLRNNNTSALKEIAERLLEAQDRGLWRPRSNSARGELTELAAQD